MTTKADTSVKWFHSGMQDAPVLSGQAGKLIELLDACLINGFSTRTPDSIVVADGVATVSISTGNPYEKHAVVVISGASNAALNAEWRIATSGASSFTFACPGVASGTATGASVKRAGAGWGKPFSDTNVAVYQSLDPSSTQLYLRVNDADSRYARVRGYEQMTDANTGDGLFPTVEQLALTNCTWFKSDTASSAARPWLVVGDGHIFHFVAQPTSTDVSGMIGNVFGDIRSFNPADKYNCIIAAHSTSAPTSGASNHPGTQFNPSFGCRHLARGGAQIGGPIFSAVFSLSSTSTWGARTGSTEPNGPGYAGERLIGSEVVARDGSAGGVKLRGIIPGYRSILQTGVVSRFEVLETDEGVFIGVDFHFGSGGAVNTIATAVVEICGPWR